MSAKERTYNDKQTIASAVLQKNATRSSLSVPLQELKVMDELTIVGNIDGGFVVIPNNDIYPEVIGYSDKGYMENAPAFSWWLNAVNQVFQSKESILSARNYITNAKNDKIDALVLSQWSQETPYNNLCPVASNGTVCPTGCVATAMAQVMKYYQYPAEGYGKGSYSVEGISGDVTFDKVAYEWDKMLPQYTKGNYSEEQANAVATIMLHCAAAANMIFSASGSGAYMYDAAKALRINFGYNDNLHMKSRDFYSSSQWMNLIYEELDKTRPIIYSASDSNYGGHCFIIDGYDQNGLVHVNWGWNGEADGYYDISLLNPSQYSFSVGQSFIFGLALPSANVVYRSEVVTEQDFKVTKLDSRLFISDNTYYNLSDRVFTGKLAYILQGQEQTYVLASAENKDVNIQYSLTKPQEAFVRISSDIADGTYRLYPAVKTEKDETWSPVRFKEGCINSWVVEKSGNTITLASVTDDNWHGTTGIKSTFIYSMPNDTDVYSLDGRKVDSSLDNLPQGIYVSKGKKIAVGKKH